MDLDSILNTVIPPIVIIVFGFLFYRALKIPINELFKSIGKAFGWGKRKVTGEDSDLSDIQTIQYE